MSSTYQTENTICGIFLSELFKRLEIKDIRYCLMRGYQELPQKIMHDIDLQIESRMVDEYINVLKKVAEDIGWLIVRKRNRFGLRFTSLVYQRNDKFEKIPIDVIISCHWKGIKYSSSNVIISSRKRFKGLWITSAGSEAAVLFFKELLQSGKIKDMGDGSHKRRIAELAKEDPNNFLATIEPYFGKAISKFALTCVKKEEWQKVEKNVWSLRRTLIWRAVRSRPLGQLLDWLCFLWGHCSDRILNSSGLFVCLIGPDGSGKTTISRRLQKDMHDVFSKVRYFHGHLGILPELKTFYSIIARIFGKPEKRVTKSKEAIHSSDDIPFNILRAISYVFYYTLDYLLGHILIKRAKGHGQLILFDRYFYDYLIQKSYAELPRWMLKAIIWVLPKPDVLIYLKNRPEIIHKRKAELSVSQIREQSKVCMDLVFNNKNAFIVETDDFGFTIQNIRQIIFYSLIRRIGLNSNLAEEYISNYKKP